jgi:2'-5' RNA ligase
MHLFFLALVLPEELNKEVLVYKRMMHEKYGCSVALKSPAHITLIPPFRMDGVKEGLLREALRSFPAFSIDLEADGFSAFPPRTIFIALKPNPELDLLKKETDAYFDHHPEFGACPDKRRFHPHITIANRDLGKKDFAEAWPSFENKKFSAHWKATRITLLKHTGRNWEADDVAKEL